MVAVRTAVTLGLHNRLFLITAASMDPHSTLSQFNQRLPKAGPSAMAVQKRAAKRVKFQSPSPERQIATNSRIKQDEKYKKEMYLAFINDALQKKLAVSSVEATTDVLSLTLAKGLTDTFDELVSQFNIKRISSDQPTPPYQPAQLRLWFSALSHVVSRLEHTHSALVQAIVGMPWTTLDGTTVRSYTVFLGHLLSARPEYLSLVLGKIAHGFTYRESGLAFVRRPHRHFHFRVWPAIPRQCRPRSLFQSLDSPCHIR